jgi:spore germination protein YaaH
VGRTWDDANAATRLTYTQDGVSHEVWFEDARSISAKLDVAQRYGVDGVFLWMYGPEDPGIWPAMTELAGQPVTRSGG